MSLIDTYVEGFGARLFPLRKRGKLGDANAKKPLVDNWRERKYRAKTLFKFWEDGHALGWALEPGDLVVDVDAPTPDRPDKKGLESLKKLEKILGGSLDRETVEVVAPSGGRHFYFRKPADVSIRKTVDELPGIEFLSAGCYVVIAGSPHWQGGSYRFSDFTDLIGDYRRSEAPEAMLDLIRKSTDIDFEAAGLAGVSGKLLAKMLSELDVTRYRDHGDWLKLLMASHSATGGSDEGRDVFVEWSTGDPNFADAGAEIAKRWDSLDEAKRGGITIATLFDELNEIGRADVVRTVRAALEFQGIPSSNGAPKDELAIIDYGLDEIQVNDAIVAALAKAKNLFQRAGSLVTIGDQGIAPVGPVSLCEIASGVCRLTEARRTKSGATRVSIRIPERVGRQIAGRGSWFGVKSLRSISPIPVLTSEGVLQTPGYDLKSGVFYKKTIDVPAIPSKPTLDQAEAARDRLFDLVADFPFASVSHRAVWLSALLSILARPAIDGPLPLFLIVGNQAAVGKSLLVDLISLIAFGSEAGRSILSRDDEEVRKSILGLAMRNQALTLFDNVENGSDFGSPVLDAVLTSRKVTDRALGRNEIIEADIETIFFATGNRLRIAKGSDSFRRVAYISIDSESEDPKSRSDFRIPDIKGFVRENRGSLIADGLTILAAARAAGERGELPAVSSWGSYEAFSDVVRRAVVWLDEPDPISTRAELEAFNEDRNELAIVVEAIRAVVGEGVPMTAGDILAALRAASEFPEEASEESRRKAEIAGDAIDVLAPSYMKDPGKAIGKRLSTRFRDRPIGGFRLRAGVDSHRKQNVYQVVKIGE